MNIDSKRFKIIATCPGLVAIRDKNAPYHCHHVKESEIPSVSELAFMTESQFDAVIAAAIYK